MLDHLSKRRNELKGFAILWIVLFHADLTNADWLYELTRLGYGGVDIFMLLSGVGLYRSLERAPDLRGYARRRAGRLLPAYLPFCALWLCVMLPTFGLTPMQSVRVALGNLTMLGFFAGVPKLVNWYPSLLLMSVALAPYAFHSLRDARRPGPRLLVWLAGTALAGVCFWGDDRIMAFSRLPIFVLGMGIARLGDWKAKPSTRACAGFAAFAVGLAALYVCFTRYPAYLNGCGMYWYPFILMAPSLCMGLCWLMDRLGRAEIVLAPLRFLGEASFEIFLFNAWAELAAPMLGMNDTAGRKLLLALASVVLGCLYHLVVRAATKRAALGRETAA